MPTSSGPVQEYGFPPLSSRVPVASSMDMVKLSFLLKVHVIDKLSKLEDSESERSSIVTPHPEDVGPFIVRLILSLLSAEVIVVVVGVQLADL